MALFLTILEGQSPGDAETIFATSDERILGAVAAEISRRFGTKDRASIRKIGPHIETQQPSDE